MQNVFTPTIATDIEAQKRVRKWIRALRSGKYVQGTGALHRTSNTFCCLGVACDLERPEAWVMKDVGGSFFDHPFGGTLQGTSGEIGWSTINNPRARRLYRLTSAGNFALASLNDTGATFKAIASILASDLRDRLATGGPVIDSRP